MKSLKNKLTSSVVSFLVIGGSCLPTAFAIPPRRRCRLPITNTKKVNQTQSETIEDPGVIAELGSATRSSSENVVNLPPLASAFAPVSTNRKDLSKAPCTKKQIKNDPFFLRNIPSKPVTKLYSGNSNGIPSSLPLDFTPVCGLSKTYDPYHPEYYLDKLSWSTVNITDPAFSRDIPLKSTTKFPSKNPNEIQPVTLISVEPPKLTKEVINPSADSRQVENDMFPFHVVPSERVTKFLSANPDELPPLPSQSLNPMSDLSKEYFYHSPEYYVDEPPSSHVSTEVVDHSLRDLDNFREYLGTFEDALLQLCMYHNTDKLFDTLMDRFTTIKHHIKDIKINTPMGLEFFNDIEQLMKNLDNLEFRSEIVGTRVKEYVERQYLNNNEQFLNQTRRTHFSVLDYAKTFCGTIPDFMLNIVYDVRDRSFQKDNLNPSEVLNVTEKLIRVFFRTMIYRLCTGEIQ